MSANVFEPLIRTLIKRRVSSILCNRLNLSVSDYFYICDTCKLTPELGDYRWTRVQSVVDGADICMIDFDVPENSAFIAGGLVTHNTKIGVMFGSPVTTSGGNALKFYASIRLETVKMKTLKKGDRRIGIRTRISAVKNKAAPPFREIFVDILPNKGITAAYGDPDFGDDK